MTYTLKFDRKPSYLHAVVTGLNSKENVIEYLEDIRRESIARGCSKLLIEERLDGSRLGTLDVFAIVREQSQRGIGPLRAIAYVDIHAKDGLLRSAETAAINRGIPMRVFPSVAQAENWLLG